MGRALRMAAIWTRAAAALFRARVLRLAGERQGALGRLQGGVELAHRHVGVGQIARGGGEVAGVLAGEGLEEGDGLPRRVQGQVGAAGVDIDHAQRAVSQRDLAGGSSPPGQALDLQPGQQILDHRHGLPGGALGEQGPGVLADGGAGGLSSRAPPGAPRIYAARASDRAAPCPLQVAAQRVGQAGALQAAPRGQRRGPGRARKLASSRSSSAMPGAGCRPFKASSAMRMTDR